MSDKRSRDFWDWADLSIRILSGIAIPAILGYFGMRLRAKQQQTSKTEEVRSTIEHLTSESWRERFMGVKVMQHYQDKKKGYPGELISAIVGILNTEKHPKVRREAAKRFSEVDSEKKESSASEPGVASSQTRSDVQKLQRQVRFYIHILEEEQRKKGNAIMDSLSKNRFGGRKSVHTLGVERVESVPSNTELRYFNPKQEPLANSIEEYLEAMFEMEVESKNLTDQFGRIPNHFELWISPK